MKFGSIELAPGDAVVLISLLRCWSSLNEQGKEIEWINQGRDATVIAIVPISHAIVRFVLLHRDKLHIVSMRRENVELNFKRLADIESEQV